MRVLLQNRGSSLNSIAGDSVQMQKTGEYLIKLGVEVDFNYSDALDLTGYDLIHLFNLIPVEETYRCFKHARQFLTPLVLSTVFWDPREYLNHHSEGQQFVHWWQTTMTMRQEVVTGVNLILPNSGQELAVLQRLFSGLPPAVVIPNGADPAFAQAGPERFIHRFGIRDFLLSVGRISPRKNQLLLIKAAKQLKLPLVLIGPLNDGLYYQECRREAVGSGTLFIDSLTGRELASAYAAARVHALVSWYETPGLASLEAALAGCAIVTTDRGGTKEYFGDLAQYCQPDNLSSICDALERAWRIPTPPMLKEEIAKKYTWPQVAMETLEAYRRLLSG